MKVNGNTTQNYARKICAKLKSAKMSSHVLAFCILPNLINRARQVNVNILEPNVPSASHSPPFML